MRAAFAAATRGAWRAGGVRDGVTGTLVPGAPASYAVWDADDFEVSAPADAVQRWSTDPRSRVPALPRLGSDDRLPRCRQTVHRGVGHPWLTRRLAEAEIPSSWPSGSAEAVVARLPRMAVAIAGGLLLCAELSAVRLVVCGDPGVRPAGLGADPRIHQLVGGFGYGLLFGLAFYMPLLPWISGLVGHGSVAGAVGRRGAVPGAVRCCWPSRCGDCPAGRCGSPRCGWPRSGPSRLCRSADSLGASSDSVKPTARCCRSRRSAGRRCCRSRSC